MVKTNQYRVLKMCPNCPFRTDGKQIELQPGRLDEIKRKLREDDSSSFTCHKTAHNLDLNMKPTEHQDPKMCAGAYEYLIEIQRPNVMMRMAHAFGIEKLPIPSSDTESNHDHK